MAYPAPKRRVWTVQIEFLDGTTIDASSDEDALDRWRRLAGWTDPTVDTHPIDWMDRVLARARSFYGAHLNGITGESEATVILDALDAEQCLSLRRK
jgi:hypothetical protein